MTVNAPIGILGGTFDPIHFGHLRIALECQQQLNLQQIRFVPCKQPTLKESAVASAQDRVAMLQLAIVDQPNWQIDERELHRTTPSYMVETLASLRTEFPHHPLCLILATDALADLPRWHRWQEILSLAHLIVTHRPGYELIVESPLTELIRNHRLTQKTDLHHQLSGGILLQETSALEISSQHIRNLIANELSPRYLLPDSVWQYIQQRGIYKN